MGPKVASALLVAIVLGAGSQAQRWYARRLEVWVVALRAVPAPLAPTEDVCASVDEDPIATLDLVVDAGRAWAAVPIWPRLGLGTVHRRLVEEAQARVRTRTVPALRCAIEEEARRLASQADTADVVDLADRALTFERRRAAWSGLMREHADAPRPLLDEALGPATAFAPALPVSWPAPVVVRLERQIEEARGGLIRSAARGGELAHLASLTGRPEDVAAWRGWVTEVEQQWLTPEPPANPCGRLRTRLESRIAELVTQFDYPSSLRQATSGLAPETCDTPVFQILRGTQVVPFGPLLVREGARLIISPDVRASVVDSRPR